MVQSWDRTTEALAVISISFWILFWAFLLSVLWAAACYGFSKRPAPRFDAAVPSLVLVPVLLVVGYRTFGVSLIFPVQMLTRDWVLILMALLPAFSLFLASGLSLRIRRNVTLEGAFWLSRGCAQFTTAMGLSARRQLMPLVVGKALLDSWAQSLPWLFGEIVVIESLFNAPGLGLDLWQAARQRDIPTAFYYLSWLVGAYGLVFVAVALGHRWLGQKLETYG